MFNSWFHIDHLATEFHRLLAGAVCGLPFTYQKNDLHIPLENAGDWRSLQFCLQAPLPFLTLEAHLPQPKHKISVLGEMAGKSITSVACQRHNRQILFVLDNGAAQLLFRLYGINGNVFLLDQSGQVLDSFKKIKKTAQPFEFKVQEFQPSRQHLPERDRIEQLLSQSSDQTLMTFLNKSLQPVLPKTLVTEICFRKGLNPKELLINLKPTQVEALAAALCELENELKISSLRIYPAEPPVFSLVELHALKAQNAIPFDSLIAAGNEFIRRFLNAYRLAERKKALIRQTDLLLATAQRKLVNQKNDLANLPTLANYREWADTLMALASQVPPRVSSVTLPSLNAAVNEITIPLDPKLNAVSNAQRYYAKARQIDESRAELAQKIAETEDLIRRYETARQQIADTTDFKALRTISTQLPVPVQAQSSIEMAHQPYTRFVLEGWEIFIGKSARDNDELTLKIARPNDFWFHAQGTTGSHVVVRNPGKTAVLPRDIREKVAGLAAFYSKAKHSTVVPVIFTQCKYVSKPRHSAPGAVAVRLEKSLIVEPLDPNKLT